MLDKTDLALTEILIDHDLDLAERRQGRKGLRWPDESDIFASTLEKIRAVFAKEKIG